jgi:murein DD-endopeptidase MepM/ murein hydrolase activator NlpD
LAAALLVALALSPAAAEKKGPSEKDLKDASRNLARAEEEAKVLGNDIMRTRSRLQQLRGEIDGLRAEVQIASSEHEKALAEFEATQDEQTVIESEQTEVQATMDERVRSLYMGGPTGAIEMLLNSESLADMGERTTFLNALQAQDANSSHTLQSLKHDLQGLKMKQKAAAKQAEKLLKYLEDQKAELQDRIEEESSTVPLLEQQLREAKALEKKWGVRVDTIAEKLNRAVVGGNGPLYACPVPDYTWWANDFGAPRVGHTHQGNDIGGNMNADIVAPFDGNAVASSDSLGGLTVRVYGKDGYVYNAHLNKYGKTGRVDAGEVIGYVGATGNAVGTSPHNHFEWHPGNGSAVDPYPYLKEVC